MGLARVLPIVSGNIELPQLNYAALIAAGAHVPEFIEPRMDGDFSFDLPANISYKSRVSPFEFDITGKTLTLQDNVAGKYLNVAAGQHGLIGPTADAREMTYAALYNYRVPVAETDTQVIMGSSSDATDGGEQVQISSSGSIALNTRGIGIIGISQAALIAQGLDLGITRQWLFVAATSKITAGTTAVHTLFVGAPTPQVVSQTGVKIIASRRMSMGNVYRAESIFTGMVGRFGRFLSGPGSRSVEQLTAMYLRAKVVAARRGMEVI